MTVNEESPSITNEPTNIDNNQEAASQDEVGNDTEEAPNLSSAGSGMASAFLMQQQIQVMIQQQQLQLQEQYKRTAEFNIREYPILKSLLPEEVTKFLVRFKVYEEGLKQSLGVKEASIFRCISYEVMPDIASLGAEISNRESILEVLNRVKSQDFEARKTFLVERLREDLIWVNKGAIPHSMRAYLLTVDNLLQGLDLDEHTEKWVCKAVITNLPKEFKSGTASETQSKRQWKTYPKMREELLQDAQILSRFTVDSPALRVGTPKKGPNLKSMQRQVAQKPTYPRNQPSKNWRQDFKKTDRERRNISNNNKGEPPKLNKPANHPEAPTNNLKRDYVKRSLEERKKIQNGNLCYWCLEKGHRFVDWSESRYL